MESDQNTIETDELKPQKRLFSFLLKNKVVPVPEESERKIYPFPTANIFSKIFFWWLFPILNVGYRRTLQPQDFFVLPEEYKVDAFVEKFDACYERELEYSRKKHLQQKCKERGETLETSTVAPDIDLEDYVLSKFSLLFIICVAFKRNLLFSASLSTITAAIVSCTPLILKKLIAYSESKSLDPSLNPAKGVGYAFGVVIFLLVSGITMNHFNYQSLLMAAKVKSSLTHAITRKSFKLSNASKHKFPDSKITSMVTTDLSRIELACAYTPFLLSLPLGIVIIITILVLNIGVAAVVGVVVLLIFLAAVSYSTSQLYRFRTVVSKLTDIRVGLVKELITNLKIIKFYSWEIPYLSNIVKSRSNEIQYILKIQKLRNIIYAVAMSLTGITAMIAFLVMYGIEGATRNASSIFSSVSSFEILSWCMNFIPASISVTADMLMALKRIGLFLSAEEIQPKDNYITRCEAKNPYAIQVTDADFMWESFEDEDEQDNNKEGQASSPDIEMESLDDSNKPLTFQGLKNINLSIAKGEFVVITGSIGTGKSSLLSAIAGIMNCESGLVEINGSLMLCGAPWVQNATIKENITFGAVYDRELYDEVVYACSLQQDLENLPAGDFTEVGERGVTLSGGQKARINLARAVYANKDIILMDDVLSAVDARVGKHMVEQCFLGILKSKTRLLATHQLSLIGSADRIIFMNGDGTIEVGTMELLLRTNDDFRKLTAFSEAEETKVEKSPSKNVEEFDIGEELIPNYKKMTDKIEGLTRRKAKQSELGDDEDTEATFRDIAENKDASKGKLIVNEERAVNRLKGEIYLNYLKFGSGRVTPWGFLLVFGTLLSLSTFCDIFSNTWLSFWISRKFDKSDGFYIAFYVLFNILWVILLTTQFILLITMTTNSSKNLNMMAVKKIMHVPMSFLDTTPMGRILNRFTKDTDALDNEISENLRLFTVSFAKLIGMVILFLVYLPWIALALPVIGILFLLVCNYYQASCREVKRLEAVQRSFVFDNLSESLSGMTTIKTLKSEERFINRGNQRLNTLNEASFLLNAHLRWLAIQLDLVTLVLVLAIALLCVNGVFKLSPATVGLLLTYSLQATGEMSNFFRLFTQVENEFNSAERICHYALKLPQEAAYEHENNAPHREWPQNGEIEFENVSMAYRPGLPMVIRDLSFKVKSSEKIGICGRTGAGKSSIITALYRLSELDQGRIIIDGVDIANIGLRDLRSKLSIIPQDPVLFNGTVRKNLDPFDEHDDAYLWKTLKRAGIFSDEEIAQAAEYNKEENSGAELSKFHLYQNVEDDGANFSLGERQLLAFARALVRDTKILILDEATSSVDYETDSKIQSIIAKEFADCTILCIAHRLKTILSYDRILTLDKGEIKEFGTPVELFNSDGGIFRQMCDKSNIGISDFVL